MYIKYRFKYKKKYFEKKPELNQIALKTGLIEGTETFIIYTLFYLFFQHLVDLD